MTGDDPIETLLRATGKRPAVSPERSERIHAATRAAWLEQVGPRRVRRRWVGALALAAAAVVSVVAIRSWRTPGTLPADEAVGVEQIVHAAWLEQGRIPLLRSRSALGVGNSLTRGDLVITEADARVALRTGAGLSLRIDHSSSLRVVSPRSFFLERGAIYVSSGAKDTGGATPIRVETPLATIEDVGTQFEARLDAGRLEVRVREGAVSVSMGGRAEPAIAGQAISVDGSGRIVRRDDPASSAGWGWVEFSLRMLDIDGRPLSEFLEWAAAERGARVRYAEPGLAERAPSIVLRGAVAGMTLDRAIASVTAASGLSHRWEGRELVIAEGR